MAAIREPKSMPQPTMTWTFCKAKTLLVEAYSNWGSDNVPRLAAAFSFYAVLSLAPMLVLAVVVGSNFYGHSVDARQALLGQARDAVGVQGAQLLAEMIDAASKGGSSVIATIISLVVTFFSASNLFIQVNDTVNAIWGIRQTGPMFRNLVMSRLIAFAGVLVVGLLVVAWLGVDSWLGWLAKRTPGFQGWQAVSFLLAVGFLTLLFAVSFRALPRRHLHWSDVWPGAIFAAVGVGVTKLLLSQYFASFNVSAAYGSAGALVVILLWIYYTGQIYFFGAEITFTYAHRYGSLIGHEESGLSYS